MLFSKKPIILVIFLTVVVVSSSFAANLDVCPGGCTYSSIQAAINMASDGDTIRVAKGLYFENVSIDDTYLINVTIQGGWDTTLTSRSTDPALTIVKGMGYAPVFDIITGFYPGKNSVTIEGLTITNGFASEGGGVCAKASADPYSMTDNSLSLTLRNNIIVGNRSYNKGGGVYIYAETYSNTVRAIVNLTLLNNRITENSACYSGGGIYIDGFSSSSYAQRSVIKFDIKGNEINGNYALYGGGAYINLPRTDYEHIGSSSIKANEINANEAFDCGGVNISIKECIPSTLEIVNNIISGNFAQLKRGGISIDTELFNGTIDLINNTITRNFGRGLDAYCGTPEFVLNMYNNIIYGNNFPPGGLEDIYLKSPSYEGLVINSGGNNVGKLYKEGCNYNNKGSNLTTDPLIGDDFHLCSGSSAIDTADASKAPATDHDGNPRAADPLPDRGAYEYLGSDHQAELPVPYESFQKEYPSIPLPVVASDKSVARPFAVYVDESTNTLTTKIALPDFSAPVDVYIGFSIPCIDPYNIYQIANDLSCKTISAYGPVKWQSAITSAVESSLYGDLDTTGAARGEYLFYMIIVPAGGSPMGPNYYYYRTSVIID